MNDLTLVNQLVAQLRGLGISLAVKGDNLLCSDPRKQLTPALRDAIRATKPQLLSVLAQRDDAGERSLSDVPLVERRSSYPATSQQRRLYTLQQLEPESIAYNITSVYRFNVPVDAERLGTAISNVIARHDSLRSRFEIEGDRLVQRVSDDAACLVEVEDIERSELETRVDDFVRPFDLEQSPLLRVKAFRMPNGETALVTDIHHSVSDGISSALLVRDFARAFSGNAIPYPTLQYGDYAVWQQEGTGRELIALQADFWKAQFEDALEPMALPTDFPRPLTRSFEGNTFSVTWDAALANRLKRFCRERDVTLFQVMFSLYGALLARLGGQEDIAIGTAVAGRSSSDLSDTIGMFVNTLALRARPAGEKRFIDYLRESKETCLGAFQNQQYPFEDLLGALDLERDASRNPLFDAFLVLQNFEGQGLGESGVQPYPIQRRTAKFDLSLSIQEIDGQLHLEFEYATALFEEGSIRRIAARLEQFVSGAIATPEAKVSELALLLPGEREHLLRDLNATTRDYPRERSIHSFFEDCAAQMPLAEALLFGEESMSYAEVEQRANRLARLLAETYGIAQGDKVALALERSFEMVIAVLAVLKTGAAYVPIDPRLPGARLDYILGDCEAKALLTQGRLGIAPDRAVPLLDLDDPRSWLAEPRPLGRLVSGDDLLYVVYTSGSTGKPKGVLIDHRVAVNCLSETERMYPLGDDGKYLLKTTYGFDVSISELFGWFLGGGALAILPPDDERDPTAILRSIARYGVTHVNFVPSMLMILLETAEDEDLLALHGLRHIILAGEAVTPALLERLAPVRGSALVENLYGPSETFYTTFQPLSDWRVGQKVPIGRPLANVRIYVLGLADELLPEGAPGELCVAGDSMARGYLGLDELTRARFVENPFEPGERLYRTGDLCRWLPDGTLEYLGRRDGQVKIRGNRVELGEVESALLAARPEIRDAVALAREREGKLVLVAYVETEAELDSSALRAALKDSLPSYMVPSFFVRLGQFPRTSSGKIDRKALPAPTEEASAHLEYVAPKNATERALVEVWAEVLKIEPETISVQADFFELGGDSLLAVMVASKSRLRDLKLTVRQIMERPTIAGLAALELTMDTVEVRDVAELARDSRVPLTFYQKGMLYNGDGARTFVIALRFNVTQPLNLDAAKRAMAAWVAHHEALRSRFFKEGETWCCRIMEKDEVEVDRLFGYRDLSEQAPQAQSEVIELDWEVDRLEIDSVAGRSAKMVVYNLGSGKSQRLHLFVSHAVCDGVAMEVLMGDLIQLYGQLARGQEPHLPQQGPSVRRVTQAFVDICNDPAALEEIPYWQGLPWNRIRPIPFDFDVTEEANTFCSHVHTEAYLEEEYTEALLAGLPKVGASMLDALLLAWIDSLCEWTGGDVGHANVIDGRGLLSRFAGDLDYTRSVGWFSTGRMHVLERPRGERGVERFQRFLAALRAMPNGGLGYDRILFSGNEQATRALAQTQQHQKLLLNYFSIAGGKDDKPKLLEAIQVGEGERVHLKSLKGRHDSLLHVPVVLVGGRLRISTDYSENLFRRSTIHGFFERFFGELRELANDLSGVHAR